MDTSNALHQLEAMSSDLFSIHSDALGIEAYEVAHKAWAVREAIRQAQMLMGEFNAACVAADV